MHVFFLPSFDSIEIMPNNTHGIVVEKFCNSVWSIGFSLSDLSNAQWMIDCLAEKTIHQESGSRNAYRGNWSFILEFSCQFFIWKNINWVSSFYMSTIRQFSLNTVQKWFFNFSTFLVKCNLYCFLSDYSILKCNYVVLIFFNKDPWCTVYRIIHTI